MTARVPRVLLLVCDSFGVGGAPDAAAYGDVGSNTLSNIAEAVGGLSLPNLLRLQARAVESSVPGGRTAAPGWGRAKSVVMVYLQGGPSHLDLWDPKENVPDNVRSTFKSIPTKLPGVQFTDHHCHLYDTRLAGGAAEAADLLLGLARILSLRITSTMQGVPGATHWLTILSNRPGIGAEKRITGTLALGLASVR